MNLLILNGARNPEGQTARAAEAVAAGVREAGGEVEHVLLPPLAVERCRQCQADGWGICRTYGNCVIDDDFAMLVGKVAEADAVVFATPVYFSDLSESMKTFLDRLRRIRIGGGDKPGIKGKAAVGICVAGGGGGGAPSCGFLLDRVLARCGFDVVDMVPVRRQNLDMKTELLRLTGEWFVGSI